jgi:hypothetical protein
MDKKLLSFNQLLESAGIKTIRDGKDSKGRPVVQLEYNGVVVERPNTTVFEKLEHYCIKHFNVQI